MTLLALTLSCSPMRRASPDGAAGLPSATPSVGGTNGVTAGAAVGSTGTATPAVSLLEVAGRASLPAGAPPGEILVALTDGPCFAEGTHYLALARATPQADPGASFGVQTFAPQGVGYEICAVLVEPGRPRVRFQGRSDRGPFSCQAPGGLHLRDVQLSLVRTPETSLPEGLLHAR